MPPAEQQMQFVFTLRSRGVTNADVLKAMEQTNRADFLEGIFQERAFEDTPLPIAFSTSALTTPRDRRVKTNCICCSAGGMRDPRPIQAPAQAAR